MKKDLDIKLYNEYLDGEKGAFELLYNKYKDKIQYFVYNIVKDYQKAEDITQDVFVYVMQNKIKEGYTFKYYIYLVAKSRAISYINTEKRRSEITEKYLSNESEEIEKDVLDIISKNEEKCYNLSKKKKREKFSPVSNLFYFSSHLLQLHQIFYLKKILITSYQKPHKYKVSFLV